MPLIYEMVINIWKRFWYKVSANKVGKPEALAEFGEGMGGKEWVKNRVQSSWWVPSSSSSTPAAFLSLSSPPDDAPICHACSHLSLSRFSLFLSHRHKAYIKFYEKQIPLQPHYMASIYFITINLFFWIETLSIHIFNETTISTSKQRQSRLPPFTCNRLTS